MLPKSISERFVPLATMPVAFLLYLALIPLENALIKVLPTLRGEGPPISLFAVIFLTWELRARLPFKAKPDQGTEPAMAGVASIAVWDRELDG